MGGHGCLAGYLPYEKFHLVFDIVHEVTRNEMLAVYKYIRVYWPKQVFFIGGQETSAGFCFVLALYRRNPAQSTFAGYIGQNGPTS